MLCQCVSSDPYNIKKDTDTNASVSVSVGVCVEKHPNQGLSF